MQLKYRGCSYNSSTSVPAAPSNAVLTYRGIQYQRDSKAPQFANSQGKTLMYRGSIYSAC